MRRPRPAAFKPVPRQRLRGAGRRAVLPAEVLAPVVPAPERSLAQLVDDLRNYQAELEIQNQALQYSQAEAEGASERFVTLFSSVPLALMVVDENSLVLQSNAMALRWFRPLEDDSPLNFLWPLVRPEHLARVTQAFDSARNVGTSEVTEVVFSAGSSGFFTGDLHMARIENTQDELAHFICAIIDQGPLLAERRALQTSANALREGNEALQLSKNRLASVINASLDAIICVDQAQRITIFNPTAAALFECPSAQALGSQLARFLPQAPPTFSTVGPSSHAQWGEMQGLTTSGKWLPMEVSASFEPHPDGDTTTIFAHDLSARKKIEAHRNALEAQLRESHKMQAVGTMAGGIAHDFNNIISAILGNVELAQQDAPAQSPTLVSLAEIDKAARRARDLVRQILTFSRNESPKRVPLQLAPVVQETVDLLKVTLPPGIELRVNISASVPAVLADATQVEQALLNLCNNAIQAIGPARGSVSIELGYSRPPSEVQIERRGGARGPHVSLAVRDTGSGIDAQTLQRVFEPFFTTKPVGQGTGLGLAVVHGIMRTHLGMVDVQSTPASGSVFTLYFPALDVAVPTPAPVEVARPNVVRGAGQRVMYVDDDEALVFLVKRALTRRGFVVSTFTNPRLAVQTLRERPLDFDLVVTDYNMPGYSGVELLREARLIRPELPVALASGYVTPEIEHSALAEGARALIHKPNDVNEMCETLQQLLRQAAHASA